VAVATYFDDMVSTDQFPTYASAIGGKHRATSLSTVKDNVARGGYGLSSDFAEEVLRAFTNALLFSPDPTRHSLIRTAAIELALAFGSSYAPLRTARASLMSLDDVRTCSGVMEQLLSHRTPCEGGTFMSCEPFWSDPVAYHGEAYRAKISEPMSLAALGSSLIGLTLASRAEFARRARLVFENAVAFDFAFSVRGCVDVRALAATLLTAFDEMWAASERALAEDAQRRARPPPDEESTCPVFTPTLAELSDFGTFVQQIERTSAFLDVGICKVVMPSGWLKHPPSAEQLAAIVIDPPIKQCVGGGKGCFSVALVEEKKLTIGEYEALAKDAAGAPPLSSTLGAIERQYWRSLTHTAPPPVYGADVLGSLFGGHRARGWNVDKLGSQLLSRIGRIPGVNAAYLYCGMWRSFFALHKGTPSRSSRSTARPLDRFAGTLASR
jgi:hypothetical protein